MNSKKLLKYTRWLWIAAVFVAGGYYLFSHWPDVAGYFQTVPAVHLAFSALFLLAGKLTMVFLSRYAIEAEGNLLPYADMLRVVAITQLGKYIPGGVWHFVGRFNAYHERNLTLKKSTRALIRENVWLVSGAFVCGLITGFLSPAARSLLERIGLHVNSAGLILIGGLLLAGWLGVLIVFERVVNKQRSVIQPAALLKIILVQVVSWLFLGISFAFVFPDPALENVPFYMSVYILSWLAGYVVIFAPGGMGIREAVLSFMLAGLLVAQDGLILATVHRFLYIAVEVFLGSVAALSGSSMLAKLPLRKKVKTSTSK